MPVNLVILSFKYDKNDRKHAEEMRAVTQIAHSVTNITRGSNAGRNAQT